MSDSESSVQFSIDRQTGAIRLPNGEVITSSLTRDELEGSSLGKVERVWDVGNGWWHFCISCAFDSERDLYVDLCFCEKLLVYVNLSVDLDPQGPKGWESSSLEKNAKQKEFQEELLFKMFGPPTEIRVLPSYGSWLPDFPILDKRSTWSFHWGSIGSSHDSRSGNTSVGVSYGNRFKTAKTDKEKRKAFYAGLGLIAGFAFVILFGIVMGLYYRSMERDRPQKPASRRVVSRSVFSEGEKILKGEECTG